MIEIVKLYTSSCVLCKMLSPILDEIKKEFNIKVEEINLDNGIPEKFQELNIMSTPTLLFYKDNKVISILSGLQTYEKIEEQIKNV